MAFRVKGAPSAPAATPRMAQIPQTSMVGKQPSALPKVGAPASPMTTAARSQRSQRNYGKTAPPAGSAPPSPFGPLGG